MVRHYFVYIMANSRPTLYIGVTNNLTRRTFEHKFEANKGFTQKYYLKKLVYYEIFTDIKRAVEREKQLKHWNRNWKLALIQRMNPTFKDLYKEMI